MPFDVALGPRSAYALTTRPSTVSTSQSCSAAVRLAGLPIPSSDDGRSVERDDH